MHQRKAYYFSAEYLIGRLVYSNLYNMGILDEMKQLFAELYQMGIRRFDTDTALSNTAAQGYYEKTGFTNAGITRSYYTK